MDQKLLFLILATFVVGTASAQQTITYTNGENDTSNIVITSTTNPTTLSLASGTATQSGNISDSGVTGTVHVTGGTLIFTGNNSYSGGTVLGASTLQIGNGGISGAIVGNVSSLYPSSLLSSTLAFDRSDTVTFGGQLGSYINLTQMGSGTLIYTGTMSGTIPYAASTSTVTISSGTLQVGNGGSSGAIDGNVVDNATLTFYLSDTATYGNGGGSGIVFIFGPANAISGTGSVIQAGSGTLVLAGANSYTGGTEISAGTLEAKGTLGTGNVVDNASLVLVGSDTLSNNITGTGSVTQNGTGLTILSGSNSYQGVTTISSGGLEFAQTAAMPGSGTVSVGSTGTLTVMVGSGGGLFTDGTSGNGTVGGLLAGFGGQAGSTVVWSAGSALGLDTSDATGTFSYGAITDTSAGTLNISKLGSGTLALTGNNTYSGSTAVLGGVLILTGSNSYAGGTTVSTATLEVSADQSLGALPTALNPGLGGITLSGGGELLTTGSGFTTNRMIAVTDSATLAAAAGTTATYAGPISGPVLTTGDSTNTGTIVFTASSSFNGSLTINGGTLEVGADVNLGGTQDALTLSGGGELLTNSAGGFTTNRAISITSAGVLAATNGTTATYGGAITGAALTIGDGVNDGTIIFASTATVTGSSSGPEVALAGNASLTNNGAVMGVNGSFGGTNGGIAVALGANARLVNNNTISGGSGSTGTANFNGFGGNGGSGGTGLSVSAGAGAINGGVISGGAGGNGGISESVHYFDPYTGTGGNGGVAVALASSASFTNNGTITGGNGGNGGTDFTTVGTFQADGGYGGVAVSLATGDSLINYGSLTGGSAGSGYVSVSGQGITASGDDLVTNAGSIIGGAGSGGQADAIDLSGGGNTLELYATSRITGNVVSSSGSTDGGDTLNLSGSSTGTFDVSTIGYGAQYQGFANYAKTGTGTWKLINTTTAVTPWTISQGVLSVSSDGALGDESGTVTLDGGTLQTTASFASTRDVAITENGGTIDTAGTSLALGGSLSGPGGLTYNDSQGTGTLTLSGTNTYAGGTTITAGTLLANGVHATGSGAVSVKSGGTLGGNGTINPSGVALGAAVTFAAGSTLNQSIVSGGLGTSTLTLNLNNGGAPTTVDLLQGSKFAFDIGASGVSDQVIVTGGTLTLNDQNLSDFTFTTLAGFYGVGTYNLITTDASGDIVGSLGDATGTIDGYRATLSVVDSQDLVLTVVPEPSTWAMVLGGVGLLTFWRRRKFRA